jgi:hypothetical protein
MASHLQAFDLGAPWLALQRHGCCADYRQKSRNLSGDISVYLTVCWMFLCPR